MHSSMRDWSWTADEIHAELAQITFARFLKSKVDELSSEDQALMFKHTPTPEKVSRWQQLVDGEYTELQKRTGPILITTSSTSCRAFEDFRRIQLSCSFFDLSNLVTINEAQLV